MKDSEQSTKHSHIQITKSLLTQFSEKTPEGRKACFLDFTSWEVKSEKIKLLGTQVNYYSQNAEDFLSKEVEGKVGDLFEAIRKIVKTGELPDIKFSTIDILNLRRFFAYCLIRSKALLTQVKQNTVFAQFFEGGVTAERLLFIPRPAMDMLSNHVPYVFINKTKIQLLIPQCCIYTANHIFQDLTDIAWVLPISPYIAIIMANKIDNVILTTQFLVSNDEVIINMLNSMAFNDEYKTNRCFLVGNKSELEKFQTAVKSSKEVQEAFGMDIHE